MARQRKGLNKHVAYVHVHPTKVLIDMVLSRLLDGACSTFLYE